MAFTLITLNFSFKGVLFIGHMIFLDWIEQIRIAKLNNVVVNITAEGLFFATTFDLV